MEVENENSGLIINNHTNSFQFIKPNTLNSSTEMKFNEDNIKKQKSIDSFAYGSEAIFPIEFIHQHFICRICKSLLHNPKQCSECEENFCENCLNEFVKNNKFCINSCSLTAPIKTHSAVTNLLEKLKFKCMFNPNEIIEYKDVEKHIKHDCKYKPHVCKFEGCNFIGTNEELAIHSDVCSYQKISCPICKAIYPLKSAKDHNCAEFFIEAHNKTKDKFKKMAEKYDSELKDVESLAEYVEKQIKSKKLKSI